MTDAILPKIKKNLVDRPRGYLRTLVLGEKEERTEAIRKGLLYGIAAVFLATFLRGLIVTGGEPLGDLKLSQEKAATDAPSLYQMEPYKEQFAATLGRQPVFSSKPTRFVGLELFKRPSVPIPAGLFVKAVLVTGASKGRVEAKVVEATSAEGEELVPAGAHLFGTAASSNDRVVIQFTKLKRPKGIEEAITAQAYDPDDKTAGLRASRFGYELKKFAFGAGLNFAAGLAEGFQDTTAQNGATYKSPSIKNAFLNGAKDAARSQGQEIIGDMRGNPPPLSISSETIFLVGFE